jgi:tryptophan synthase alpha chain
MKKITDHIHALNLKNRKALSVFLTAGFPDPNRFVDLALETLNNGADLLELGIPFSDPIADGPVIQQASQKALENGVTIKTVFKFSEKIKRSTAKPLILMGYANPILHYGTAAFINDARNCGVDGLIIPDIPIDEHDNFWENNLEGLDQIHLTTPTSPAERVKLIDRKSTGFVYCVSVTGTTGIQNKFSKQSLENLKRTYHLIKNNKMLIGFGISKPEDIRIFRPFCDGVIVGSAVINHLRTEENTTFDKTIKFIKMLSEACWF